MAFPSLFSQDAQRQLHPPGRECGPLPSPLRSSEGGEQKRGKDDAIRAQTASTLRAKPPPPPGPP